MFKWSNRKSWRHEDGTDPFCFLILIWYNFPSYAFHACHVPPSWRRAFPDILWDTLLFSSYLIRVTWRHSVSANVVGMGCCITLMDQLYYLSKLMKRKLLLHLRPLNEMQTWPLQRSSVLSCCMYCGFAAKNWCPRHAKSPNMYPVNCHFSIFFTIQIDCDVPRQLIKYTDNTFHKPINSDLNSVCDIALHIFTLRFFRFGTPTIVLDKDFEHFVKNFMKILNLL
jgi:hypothetical protein